LLLAYKRKTKTSMKLKMALTI